MISCQVGKMVITLMTTNSVCVEWNNFLPKETSPLFEKSGQLFHEVLISTAPWCG